MLVQVSSELASRLNVGRRTFQYRVIQPNSAHCFVKGLSIAKVTKVCSMFNSDRCSTHTATTFWSQSAYVISTVSSSKIRRGIASTIGTTAVLTASPHTKQKHNRTEHHTHTHPQPNAQQRGTDTDTYTDQRAHNGSNHMLM